MKEMYSGWGRNDSAGWERWGGSMNLLNTPIVVEEL